MVNSREYLEKMGEDYRNHRNSVSPICYGEDTCESPIVRRMGVVIGSNEGCDFQGNNEADVVGVIGLIRGGVNFLVDEVCRFVLLGE